MSTESSWKLRQMKVITIDMSGPVRQLLTDVVRSKGIEFVQSVSSIKDCLGLLEQEHIDWIITPLLKDMKYNALQLLELVTREPSLKHIRISLLIEAEDDDLLPTAFDLGCFSIIEKPFNKESFSASIDEILSVLDSNDGQSTKVASFYARKAFFRTKDGLNWLRLEKSLLQLFPGYSDALLGKAQAHHMLGEDQKAVMTLDQALLIDPSSKSRVEELKEKISSQMEIKPSSDVEGMNALGIELCVIVDPDSDMVYSITQILKSLGVLNIETFDNGEKAYEFCCHNPVDLILQEWRIPNLPGPVFLQRLRKHSPTVPMIAISSLLKESDLMICKEMGLNGMLEKPVDSQKLLQLIVQVISQDRNPSNLYGMECKIQALLAANQVVEAHALKEKYLGSKDLLHHKKLKMMAEFAYHEGSYLQARNLAVDAIKNHTDSIALLNLLGKSLMKLQDFLSAIKCFEKAQSMSPLNIQRLCAIAEANSELDQHDKAQKVLQSATTIDPGSTEVLETTATTSLAAGDIETAKRVMSRLESLTDVVAYMNNKAVAYSRNGQVEEGVKQYRQTIAAIPDDQSRIKSLVTYNLALAHTRSKDLLLAKAATEEALEIATDHIKEKCQSLLKRIKHAVEKGEEVSLRSAAATEATISNTSDGVKTETMDDLMLEAALDIAPGELCCHKVLNLGEGDRSKKAQDLLSESIRFVSRDSIVREEAQGVERMRKSG